MHEHIFFKGSNSIIEPGNKRKGGDLNIEMDDAGFQVKKPLMAKKTDALENK